MSDEATLVLLLVVAATAALAGCTDQGDPIDRFAIDAGAEDPGPDPTWPAPVAHDGNRTLLDDHDLAGSEEEPAYVQQLLPGGGGEPNIGVTSEGNLFVTTLEKTQRSTDKGRTWETVYEFEPPGRPVTEDVYRTADPMLWVDPDTDRIFTDHMHPASAPASPWPVCTYLSWSDDEGDTWTERPLSCGTPGLDHPKIVTAPPGPDVPSQATLQAAYPNVVYLCVNKFQFGTWCSTSLDGGASFAYDREAAPAHDECGAINGHPHPFPDGTLAVPLGSFGSCERPVGVAVTTDNGLTWEVRRCDTELAQTEIDPDITVTPDGTAYMLFRGDDQRVHLARTTDKFQTCDVFDVSPPDHTLNVFTAITSGDDGRIAMSYLGTDDEQYRGATPSNASGGTEWHLHVTTSIDAGSEEPTFLTNQVTPEDDPVQLGCVWLRGGGGGPQDCRNLLDFIDASHDEEGRVFVAFTDGCIPRNGCAQNPDDHGLQSRGRQVAVAVQTEGVSLFEDEPALEPLDLEHPGDPHQAEADASTIRHGDRPAQACPSTAEGRVPSCPAPGTS